RLEIIGEAATRLAVDREHAVAGIHHVAGGNKTVRADGVYTGDPAQAILGGRGEADFLAPGIDVEELTLVLVGAVEQLGGALVDGQDVPAVAGQELLDLVEGGD